MSITLSASKRCYLERVAEGLADLPDDDREEVIHDLEAHLAELDDADVEATLGSPAAFVEEFRRSAGLDQSSGPRRFDLLDRTRARLASVASRLSDLVRWPKIRPTWVWVRGWLIVSAWAWAHDMETPEYLVVPRISGSTLMGLLLVIGATALSLWLDRGPEKGPRSVGSVAISVLASWATLAILANPMPAHSVYEEPVYFDQLMSAEGEPITNIYAYDVDGDPVQVLLFDQSGRPLLTLPSYVYQEDSAQSQEPYHYDGGVVTFERDQYGRVIPNLFPLELSTYDGFGNLIPMPPPSVGFPSVEEEETGDASSVSTTTSPTR